MSDHQRAAEDAHALLVQEHACVFRNRPFGALAGDRQHLIVERQLEILFFYSRELSINECPLLGFHDVYREALGQPAGRDLVHNWFKLCRKLKMDQHCIVPCCLFFVDQFCPYTSNSRAKIDICRF